ncbi:MAG: type II toxin-antitoxin system VapC family toxin [Gemmatimonadetes bacterium]|nr:type II toxin-antitoxin system VapC family toxin [Gemmatimonadota bacterium]MYA43713.1 type II toxin-antitoxin system VapC family toxin [Gemmatimonadota bacterium]MYE94148.1 type II toxin-antitoxin system VapC family toxin [Gemmatimonadota bacterium]MYJ09674.1 type II toxin-antitoxin system VapC family toxin [Gemmatimonadota bacterium]
MRLLLDTHAFLWWLSDWEQIAEATREAIADPDNEVFISAVSGWEIAIKKAKGRLAAPSNLASVVQDRGFTHLPLTFEHAERSTALPNHHRDPFDRMLIAQAQAEGLVLVTRDARIPLYDVLTMSA